MSSAQNLVFARGAAQYVVGQEQQGKNRENEQREALLSTVTAPTSREHAPSPLFVSHALAAPAGVPSPR